MSLSILTPSITFVTVGLGWEPGYTTNSTPLAAKLSVIPLNSALLADLFPQTIKAFLNPLDFISSGKLSEHPGPIKLTLGIKNVKAIL